MSTRELAPHQLPGAHNQPTTRPDGPAGPATAAAPSTSVSDPTLPRLLQAFTLAEVLVLAGASAGLLFAPQLTKELWPWALTPFNTRFLGAVYASAMVSVALVLVIGRWAAARAGVLAILVFTAMVLLVSLAYAERFETARWATAVWWGLYVALPLNSAYQLWRFRAAGAPDRISLGPAWELVVRGLAAAMTLYGLALLVAPQVAAAFWPWPIDAFHGRLYSAAFVTGGVGLASVRAAGSRWGWLAASASQALLGVLALGGLLVVDAAVDKVAWRAVGTWVWIAMFAMLAVVGGLLFGRALAGPSRRTGEVG